jgi:hypothetical protein
MVCHADRNVKISCTPTMSFLSADENVSKTKETKNAEQKLLGTQGT